MIVDLRYMALSGLFGANCTTGVSNYGTFEHNVRPLYIFSKKSIGDYDDGGKIHGSSRYQKNKIFKKFQNSNFPKKWL